MSNSVVLPRSNACEEATRREPSACFSAKIQEHHRLRLAIV